jgi:hypothetical protein
MKRFAAAVGLLAVLACAPASLVSASSASEVISTTTVTGLTLQVNSKGEALLTYSSRGKRVHVLAWGAINALPTAPGKKQVAFHLDYSGGYQKYFLRNPAARALAKRFRKIRGTPGYLANPVVKKLRAVQLRADFYWRNAFHGGCRPYTGPTLAWAVAECTAPDGTYWAVQEWQRKLPDYGMKGDAADDAYEVHLSHWRGPLPVLTVGTDWSWHQWNHLFGTLTYLGHPVFGLASTSSGQPLDSFGRNIYVDTFDSVYGAGWKRENSFLTHKSDGVLCYSINPHGSHPAGTGKDYRATVMGPGVTPDVMWEGRAPGTYDRATDAERNLAIAGLHDSLCRPN